MGFLCSVEFLIKKEGVLYDHHSYWL